MSDDDHTKSGDEPDLEASLQEHSKLELSVETRAAQLSNANRQLERLVNERTVDSLSRKVREVLDAED